VKEKVLAAHRSGIRTVLLPEGNRKDLDDVPAEVQEVTSFVFVTKAEEALAALFAKKAFATKATRGARATGGKKKAAAKRPRSRKSPASS
jgi:ATP-dependent Lon protease, bacterial type